MKNRVSILLKNNLWIFCLNLWTRNFHTELTYKAEYFQIESPFLFFKIQDFFVLIVQSYQAKQLYM